METVFVEKWGKDYGIRLSKKFVEECGYKIGTVFLVEKTNEGILLTPKK